MTCEDFRTISNKAVGQSTSAERVAGMRHYHTCRKCRYEVEEACKREIAEKGIPIEQLLESGRQFSEILKRDLTDGENQ